MIDNPPQDNLPVRILILEDCADRRSVMEDCLSDRFPQYGVRFFLTAPEMVEYLKEQTVDDLMLISLDHDLEPPPNQPGSDPGCGRDVADCLSTMKPVCPVVIHTTNNPAGDGMRFVLDDAGWTTIRIVPYDGEQWIGETWFRGVRNAIVRSVSPTADLPV